LRRTGEFQAPDGTRRQVFVQHDGWQALLGLTQDRHGSQDAFDETRAGLDHLAFPVVDRGELDAWTAALADAAAVYSPVIAANSVPDAAVLVFADPGSIQLEFRRAATIDARNLASPRGTQPDHGKRAI
jgi:glyoxylase I family protein